jgi:hypothetical protein
MDQMIKLNQNKNMIKINLINIISLKII